MAEKEQSLPAACLLNPLGQKNPACAQNLLLPPFPRHNLEQPQNQEPLAHGDGPRRPKINPVRHETYLPISELIQGSSKRNGGQSAATTDVEIKEGGWSGEFVCAAPRTPDLQLRCHASGRPSLDGAAAGYVETKPCRVDLRLGGAGEVGTHARVPFSPSS